MAFSNNYLIILYLILIYKTLLTVKDRGVGNRNMLCKSTATRGKKTEKTEKKKPETYSKRHEMRL